MDVICKKDDLLKILSISINAVSERTTIEALKCFKLEAIDNKLFITSNNLETNIIGSLNAKVNNNGKTLVHAKTFLNIVSKLPKGDVSLYLSDNNSILITSGNSTFNIFISNIDEFPEDMTLNNSREVVINRNIFKDMMKRVSFSASDEEEKVILNGVLFNLNKEKNKLIFVAADGYRLAKDEIKFKTDEDINTIIPIKTIKEVGNITTVIEKDEIIIKIDDDKVLFLLDEISLYSRVINGKFPDYNLLLPKEVNLSININRKEFLDACERINIIAQRNSFMVKIELIESYLVISSVTPDFGDGSEKIKVVSEGEDINVVFNVRLMMDVLKNIESEQIRIEIINDEKPISIKEENNSDYIYIMMPIKVKRDK
ncbi:MAG: DNA polymerase III subunit beta [Candidatus Margulisbacteria bacterium GWF2_35_9]|nr:MAG: DNA polymerase III subunit beta [Candidatus Margulisbacteria bacterium GWF2_35_9]